MNATTTDYLLALHGQHGHLTPEIVLDDARDESSPLHDHFDWDDASAAEAHRLDQARGLIRRVKVRRISADGAAVRVRMFASIQEAPGTKGAYRRIDELDAVEISALQAQMKLDIAALVAKYHAVSGFVEELHAQVSAAA